MGVFWYMMGQQAAKDQARARAQEAERATTESPPGQMTPAQQQFMDIVLAGGFLFVLIGGLLSSWLGCRFWRELGACNPEEGQNWGCGWFLGVCTIGPLVAFGAAVFVHAVIWAVRTLLCV